MPELLLKSDDAGRELKRLLVADLADAVAALGDAARPQEARVHAARRKLKRARSLLRVLKPHLGGDYARRRADLRAAAGELSGTRDLDVMAATAANLVDHAPGKLRPVIGDIAVRVAREAEAAHATATPVEAVMARLRTAQAEAEALAEPDDGKTLFRTELARAYKAARKAMAVAGSGRGEQPFHDWRKRVKHHYHLSRMVKGAGKATAKKVVADLDALGELLGVEHDHAVLAARLLDDPLLAGDGRTADRLHEVIDARRAKLQKKAFRLGAKLYADKLKAFRDAIHAD